jgi:aspartate/methionine/tyrosine aminotransferase
MALRPSARGLVPPFIAMDVMRAANAAESAGQRVIHLEVGNPGTPAPQAVLAAARHALAADRIGYTDALGIAPLRQAIAASYRTQYGVAVDLAEVVVTTGSSAAFQLAFLAAFEPGDRVALASPGYPAYRNILTALGLEAVLIEVGENAHYQPNPELLAEARSRRAHCREPRQPDRNDDPGRRSRTAIGVLPGARYPPRLGRDLSRHHLRGDAANGARLW